MKQKMIKNLKVNVSSSNVCWSFFILKTLHFILFSYQFSKTNFAGFSEQKDRNEIRFVFLLILYSCFPLLLLFAFSLCFDFPLLLTEASYVIPTISIFFVCLSMNAIIASTT
jgi:hypothetical protein